MSSNRAETITPISNRQPVRFAYRRIPSAIMPEPVIPERVILPLSGIHEVFELRLAVDDATESDAFAVRWQVYCRELGYEPADRFPDRREWDDDDLRSVQVVAYHRSSGLAVGCFRLLLADPQRPEELFHMEKVCTGLVEGALNGVGNDRLGLVELSRFCITAPFRRFDAMKDDPPDGIDPKQWQEQSVHRRGLAGLMWLTAAHLSVTLRFDYLLALMEPRLQSLVKAIGFVFTPIGGPVDFRGERVPYRIDRRSLRSLLQVPATARLVEPMRARLDSAVLRHPNLQSYISSRTTTPTRPQTPS